MAFRSGLSDDVVAGAWQARGHLAADVDPLGITSANLPDLGMRAPSSELIMRKYFKFGTQAWGRRLFGSNHLRKRSCCYLLLVERCLACHLLFYMRRSWHRYANIKYIHKIISHDFVLEVCIQLAISLLQLVYW